MGMAAETVSLSLCNALLLGTVRPNSPNLSPISSHIAVVIAGLPSLHFAADAHAPCCQETAVPLIPFLVSSFFLSFCGSMSRFLSRRLLRSLLVWSDLCEQGLFSSQWIPCVDE